MKYRIGNRIKIKSFDWCSKNFDMNKYGRQFQKYCGKIMTVCGWGENSYYYLEEDATVGEWTDEMIECRLGGAPIDEIRQEIKLSPDDFPKPMFKNGDRITNGEIILKVIETKMGKYVVETECGQCTSISTWSQFGYSLVTEVLYQKILHLTQQD